VDISAFVKYRIPDHPNIAKVLDAGATDAGRPYFVMELVRGIKITDYCDQQKLSTRQRLDLFVQVCQAVQHAHQKGIIHRDLKPSNILVTEQDGKAVPKIIDFGIAKATTAAPLTDKTLFTAFDQFIGTPAYMSPEQAGLGGLDIDTRSDVYSLGVLLYELLTGKQPFDSAALRRSAIDEILRIIREQEPPRPSACLTTFTEQELTVAAVRRQTEPAKFSKLLRGDLDWIVMKTLEKDRARRYETANGLAADLKRHVNNEPVTARPPSNFYRFQRMVRRNKLLFAATSAVAAVLIIGLAASTWMFFREREAHQQAVAAELEQLKQHKLADENARKATDSEQSARRLLYAADIRLASQAWADGNLSRMVSLLDAHQPKLGQPDPRGFEYFYLRELAKGEQEYTLHGHTNKVWGVGISPDGKWLASRSETDTRLWDLAHQTQVAVWPSLKLPEGFADWCGVSFSYDNQYLAIETEAGLQLCQLSTLQTRMLTTRKVVRAFFSPVTNSIAYNWGDDSNPAFLIYTLDYLTREQIRASSLARNRLTPIWNWSPDGSRLLTDQGLVDVSWWDAKTLTCVETNRGKQRAVNAAVSRDGRMMALADRSGEISLLETPGGKLLSTFNGSSPREMALAFAPSDKYLMASGRNQSILIWRIADGRQVGELRGHYGKVHALAYSPVLDRLASGGEDGDVMIWNPNRLIGQTGISNPITNLSGNLPNFSPDGKSIVLSDDWTHSRILASSNLTEATSYDVGRVVSYSPDGRQLALFNPQNWSTNFELLIRQAGSQSNRAVVHVGLPESRQGFMAKLSPNGNFVAITAQKMGKGGWGGNVYESLLCDALSGKKFLRTYP
jgi:WD40 repeat protein